MLHLSKNSLGHCMVDGAGCSNIIYIVEKLTEHYVKNSCTMKLCSIDLSRAFEKINPCALFIKLMNRRIPVIGQITYFVRASVQLLLWTMVVLNEVILSELLKIAESGKALRCLLMCLQSI
jgi:hypothetical protein